jgi:hypothetical protein
VIVVKTNAVTAETIDAMIDVARTTTTARTTIARSDLHRHCQKEAIPTMRSSQPTER